MPLAITPATPADGPAIAAIWASAFQDDALDRTIYAAVPLATRIAWAAPFVAACIAHPHIHLLKAIDDSAAPLAFAAWETVGPQGKLRDAEAIPLPYGADRALSAAFQAHADEVRDRVMRGKEYLHLVILATAPAHQRRGAARQLLQWGQTVADVARLPAYVEASSAASRALYARAGWCVVEDFCLVWHAPVGDGGGAEPPRFCQWCMVREPQTETETGGGEERVSE